MAPTKKKSAAASEEKPVSVPVRHSMRITHNRISTLPEILSHELKIGKKGITYPKKSGSKSKSKKATASEKVDVYEFDDDEEYEDEVDENPPPTPPETLVMEEESETMVSVKMEPPASKSKKSVGKSVGSSNKQKEPRASKSKKSVDVDSSKKEPRVSVAKSKKSTDSPKKEPRVSSGKGKKFVVVPSDTTPTTKTKKSTGSKKKSETPVKKGPKMKDTSSLAPSYASKRKVKVEIKPPKQTKQRGDQGPRKVTFSQVVTSTPITRTNTTPPSVAQVGLVQMEAEENESCDSTQGYHLSVVEDPEGSEVPSSAAPPLPMELVHFMNGEMALGPCSSTPRVEGAELVHVRNNNDSVRRMIGKQLVKNTVFVVSGGKCVVEHDLDDLVLGRYPHSQPFPRYSYGDTFIGLGGEELEHTLNTNSVEKVQMWRYIVSTNNAYEKLVDLTYKYDASVETVRFLVDTMRKYGKYNSALEMSFRDFKTEYTGYAKENVKLKKQLKEAISEKDKIETLYQAELKAGEQKGFADHRVPQAMDHFKSKFDLKSKEFDEYTKTSKKEREELVKEYKTELKNAQDKSAALLKKTKSNMLQNFDQGLEDLNKKLVSYVDEENVQCDRPAFISTFSKWTESVSCDLKISATTPDGFKKFPGKRNLIKRKRNPASSSSSEDSNHDSFDEDSKGPTKGKRQKQMMVKVEPESLSEDSDTEGAGTFNFNQECNRTVFKIEPSEQGFHLQEDGNGTADEEGGPCMSEGELENNENGEDEEVIVKTETIVPENNIETNDQEGQNDAGTISHQANLQASNEGEGEPENGDGEIQSQGTANVPAGMHPTAGLIPQMFTIMAHPLMDKIEPSEERFHPKKDGNGTAGEGGPCLSDDSSDEDYKGPSEEEKQKQMMLKLFKVEPESFSDDSDTEGVGTFNFDQEEYHGTVFKIEPSEERFHLHEDGNGTAGEGGPSLSEGELENEEEEVIVETETIVAENNVETNDQSQNDGGTISPINPQASNEGGGAGNGDGFGIQSQENVPATGNPAGMHPAASQIHLLPQVFSMMANQLMERYQNPGGTPSQLQGDMFNLNQLSQLFGLGNQFPGNQLPGGNQLIGNQFPGNPFNLTQFSGNQGPYGQPGGSYGNVPGPSGFTGQIQGQAGGGTTFILNQPPLPPKPVKKKAPSKTKGVKKQPAAKREGVQKKKKLKVKFEAQPKSRGGGKDEEKDKKKPAESSDESS